MLSFEELRCHPLFAGALRLVLERWPDTTEGTVLPMLRICALNAGLIVPPGVRPEFLIGYFRYWPEHIEAVAAADWDALWGLKLERGPLLHFAAVIFPGDGQRLIRDLVAAHNPLGVSCHRLWRGRAGRTGWRFAYRPNLHFRKAGAE